MKKISTLLALSAASLVGIFAACSSSENSDKIIAEVGAEKIYQSDLEFLKRTAPVSRITLSRASPQATLISEISSASSS